MFYAQRLCSISLAVACSCATADERLSPESVVSGQSSPTVRSITPIFSQLVLAPFPTGFITVFENTQQNQYIRESVLNGETKVHWTQMITITGAKELSLNPNATPRKLVERIAGGFQKSCSGSFKAVRVSGDMIDGYEAFAAIASCGSSSATGGTQSETALIEVIRGEKDFYTLQWAERAAPSNLPLELDLPKWIKRFKQVAQVKLCPIVPGEPPPYPSCVDRK